MILCKLGNVLGVERELQRLSLNNEEIQNTKLSCTLPRGQVIYDSFLRNKLQMLKGNTLGVHRPL